MSGDPGAADDDYRSGQWGVKLQPAGRGLGRSWICRGGWPRTAHRSRREARQR
jgi:hypothetical protein